MRGEQQKHQDQSVTAAALNRGRLLLDANGRILGGDAAAFDLIAQSPRDAIGRSLTSFLDAATADRLSAAARNLQTHNASKSQQPISGATAVHAGGASITLQLAPVRPSNTQQSDNKTTQRVRYVAQIQASSESAPTSELAARLNNYNDHDANHLLRTHLNTILGYAELAQTESAQDNPRRRSEQLAAIASAGRALAAAAGRDAKFASVMNACVEPARQNHEPVEPASSIDSVSPCWIDLSSALSETRITSLKMRAMHQRARLTVDLQDAPRRVIAGRARLKTAVEALCQFAIDTVGGGGRVLLHVVQLDDGGVAIDIVDDGPGWRISPDVPMPSRLKNLLSKVRGIMAVDNARVEFQSVPGAGSTARIAFLPESVIS